MEYNTEKQTFYSERNFYSSLEEVRKSGKISSISLWWECKNNHHWQKTFSEYKRYPNCPYCILIEKNNVIIGVNDIVTLYPEIENIWSEKNKFSPEHYTEKSKYKAYLKSGERKSIESLVSSIKRERISSSLGVQEKVISRSNFSPLSQTHPVEAEKFFLCSGIDPKTVSFGSTKIVDFTCVNYSNHQWSEKIKLFVKKSGTCPYCSFRKVLPGFNDLETTHPHIAREIMDKSLSHTLMKNSSKKINWKCELGHIWEAQVDNRVNGNSKCPYCSHRKVLAGFNDLGSYVPGVVKKWHSKNNLSPFEITRGSESPIFLVCEKDKNHIVETVPYVVSRSKEKEIFYCSTCRESAIEKDFINTIKNSINEKFEVIENDRKALSGKEIDLYIPSLRIGFEFNRVYWHSDLYSSPNDHYDKWKLAKDKNIKLFTIWEDDWVNKKEIVHKMCLSKIGLNKSSSVMARKTYCSVVNKEHAIDFMDSNHIQGYSQGSNFGLYEKDSDKLVALMTIKLIGDEVQIIRYATHCRVPGGFTKLLNFVENYYPSAQKVTTFAAHDVSDGGLYENNGFVVAYEIPPDYQYLHCGVRKHKFNFRINNFKINPQLKFVEGKTEKELAELNNLRKVYDCGKTKYTKVIKRK